MIVQRCCSYSSDLHSFACRKKKGPNRNWRNKATNQKSRHLPRIQSLTGAQSPPGAPLPWLQHRILEPRRHCRFPSIPFPLQSTCKLFLPRLVSPILRPRLVVSASPNALLLENSVPEDFDHSEHQQVEALAAARGVVGGRGVIGRRREAWRGIGIGAQRWRL